MSVLSMNEIENALRLLLKKYHAEYAILFGSYARGEATPESDLDVVIVGGRYFAPHHIFSLAEELREMLDLDADVFELRELDPGTEFYKAVFDEGVRIA